MNIQKSLTIQRPVLPMFLVVATAAFLAIQPAPASAGTSKVFTPPYSGDSAAWGGTDVDRLNWQTTYSASKTNGAVAGGVKVWTNARVATGEVFSGSGTIRALGQVEQTLTQNKPLWSVAVSIEYDIASATVRADDPSAFARVWLDASLWNANCACEHKSSVLLLQSQGLDSFSFSGPRSLTLGLQAPSKDQLIKGTVIIRAGVRAEGTIYRAFLMLHDRSATADVNAIVKRISYHT